MKRMQTMDIKALLEMYIRAAQGYIDETREGTARGANRHHAVAERVFKELKRRGQGGEILMLLSHPRPAVRLWAAVHALSIEPASGQKVLASLRKDPTPAIRADARIALEDFEKGELPEPQD